MSVTVVVVLLIVVIGGFVMLAGMRPDIRGPEARALVEGGARLLDVRSPGEFAAGHLPGAVNIPVEVLERRIGDVGPKDRPVVVYCASGSRSAHARNVLKAKGWSDVRNLGPMGAW